MNEPYGSATLRDHGDGVVEVVAADDVIGVSLELLAQPGFAAYIDRDGLLWLGGDPAYRYRPVRFHCPVEGLEVDWAVEGVRVLICERVR